MNNTKNMKTFIFLLLTATQLLLPSSFHTPVSSHYAALEQATVHKSQIASISSLELKKEFLADNEIGVEDNCETFTQLSSLAPFFYEPLNPSPTLSTSHEVEFSNFLLIYISRFSTSPPAALA